MAIEALLLSSSRVFGGAYLDYRRDSEPAELAPGADLSWLLAVQPHFDTK